MTIEEKAEFITNVAREVDVCREVDFRDIKVSSPIIGQAILESGWGTSDLARNAFNFFGLTAAKDWNGPVYEHKTKEEINGELVEMVRPFRAYSNMEEGIRGYFEFISRPRYENLKGVREPEVYLTRIVEDGYCTATGYAVKIMNLILEYSLTRFDMLLKDRARLIYLGRYGNGIDRINALGNLGFTPHERSHLQLFVDMFVDEQVEKACRAFIELLVNTGTNFLNSPVPEDFKDKRNSILGFIGDAEEILGELSKKAKSFKTFTVMSMSGDEEERYLL